MHFLGIKEAGFNSVSMGRIEQEDSTKQAMPFLHNHHSNKCYKCLGISPSFHSFFSNINKEYGAMWMVRVLVAQTMRQRTLAGSQNSFLYLSRESQEENI